MISIDWKKAEEIFGILLGKLARNEYPYNLYRRPNAPENLPEKLPRGGREHALYLLISCIYMRGRLNSDTAFAKLRGVYKSAPEFFTTDWFVEGDGRRQVEIMRLSLPNLGMGYGIREATYFWVHNMRKIASHWGGDPRRLYTDHESYDDMCASVIGDTKSKKDPSVPRGFLGYRYKMTSMLAYFLVSSELTALRYLFPIPVDFHVNRMFTSNEILVGESVTYGESTRLSVKKLETAARELSFEFCRKRSVNPVDLTDAIWHLSRWGCRRNMGNQSTFGRYRQREVKPKGVWSDAQIRTYEQTCQICPVTETCKWNIPASNTYNQGIIMVRGARPTSPQPLIRFGSWTPPISFSPKKPRVEVEDPETTSKDRNQGFLF